MPAQYTIQLSPEDLKTIMEDPERVGITAYTVIGTDREGNQLPSISINVKGHVSDPTGSWQWVPVDTQVDAQVDAQVEVPVEDTEEVIVDPSEEEEIGNVAPEEAAAVAAMGFDPMTESKISSFSTFLKRK